MRIDSSRRGFLGSLVPGAAAAVSLNLPALAAASAGEQYWTLVRNQFSFPEDKVPMNAANLCPATRAVAERVADLTRDIDGDCSFQNRAKYQKLLEDSRSRIASQLGVTGDEIALVRNTSEANNIINNGLPLKSGDEVVIWGQNHPTNNVAWDVRAARYGIAIKRVTTPAAPEHADELVAAFERALTPKSRVLSITHLSNTSGVRLPVRQLGELARSRGLHFHVDGAQSWGALNVNLRELGCDSYSASAHKWFMGPKEVGLLYVRSARVPEIWPNTIAPGWGNDADPDVVGARKFESLGQRDDASLAALRTAADLHDTIGASRIEGRVLELAAALKSHIRNLDLHLVTPADASLSGGVIIVRADAAKGEQASEALYRKWGIAAAPTGGVRLCPHVYNTMEHIDRAGKALKELRHLFT